MKYAKSKFAVCVFMCAANLLMIRDELREHVYAPMIIELPALAIFWMTAHRILLGWVRSRLERR